MSDEPPAHLEGTAWILPDRDARWADPARRAMLLAVVRLLETGASVAERSAHRVVVRRV